MAPETLFEPCLFDQFNVNEADGVHEMIFQSIQKCDIDIKKEMYGNIVLSGGNTLLPGFAERITTELDNKAPRKGLTKVIASDNRYNSVWVGASTLSSLSTFNEKWVTKEEYDQQGA